MIRFQRSDLLFWCAVLGMSGFNVLSMLNVSTVLKTELTITIALLGTIAIWMERRRK